MKNFLLARSLSQFLSEPLIVVGVVLITIGISLGILSRRIARAIRQCDAVESSDRVFVAFKLAGMASVTAGFALIAFTVIVCCA